MMDDDEIATYANSIAAALRVIGATPRVQVLGMLTSLQLAEGEAAAVISYALTHRILVEEGADLRTYGEAP